MIWFKHSHLESCAGLTCRGIARGAGGNGTLEATGLPEFMPFGAEKEVMHLVVHIDAVKSLPKMDTFGK